jgi:hypothetical protein
MKRLLPISCPSCNHALKVSKLIFTNCDVAVELTWLFLQRPEQATTCSLSEYCTEYLPYS